jgi:hypothetical protein
MNASNSAAGLIGGGIALIVLSVLGGAQLDGIGLGGLLFVGAGLLDAIEGIHQPRTAA